MKTTRAQKFFTILSLAAAAQAFAADTAPAPAAAPDKLAAARAQIAAKQWPAAVAELRKVNDTGSADWNNLGSFAL